MEHIIQLEQQALIKGFGGKCIPGFRTKQWERRNPGIWEEHEEGQWAWKPRTRGNAVRFESGKVRSKVVGHHFGLNVCFHPHIHAEI